MRCLDEVIAMASLTTTHRWVVAHQDPRLADELSCGLGIAPLVARIMVAHGISSVEEGRRFLTPSLERDWADPLVIPGMAEVADRVERAIREGSSRSSVISMSTALPRRACSPRRSVRSGRRFIPSSRTASTRGMA